MTTQAIGIGILLGYLLGWFARGFLWPEDENDTP